MTGVLPQGKYRPLLWNRLPFVVVVVLIAQNVVLSAIEEARPSQQRPTDAGHYTSSDQRYRESIRGKGAQTTHSISRVNRYRYEERSWEEKNRTSRSAAGHFPSQMHPAPSTPDHAAHIGKEFPPSVREQEQCQDLELVDRRVNNPLFSKTLLAEEWRWQGTAIGLIPKETVFMDFPSLNLSQVEVILSITQDMVSPTQLQFQFYPILPTAPLPGKTTWTIHSALGCPYCESMLASSVFSVVMPSRRHILQLLVLKPGEVHGQCDQRTNMSRICAVALWFNGQLVQHTQKEVFGGEFDSTSLAFVTMPGAGSSMSSLLGRLIMFVGNGFEAIGGTSLWSADILHNFTIGNWSRLDAGSPAHPSPRTSPLAGVYQSGIAPQVFRSSEEDILLFGGVSTVESRPATDTWLYTAVSGSWLRLPDLPSAAQPLAVALDASKEVLMVLAAVYNIHLLFYSTALYTVDIATSLPTWLEHFDLRPGDRFLAPIMVSGTGTAYLLSIDRISQSTSFEIRTSQPFQATSPNKSSVEFVPLVGSCYEGNYFPSLLRLMSHPLLHTYNSQPVEPDQNIEYCTGYLLGNVASGPLSAGGPITGSSLMWKIGLTVGLFGLITEATYERHSYPNYPQNVTLQGQSSEMFGKTIVATAMEPDDDNNSPGFLLLFCFDVESSRWQSAINTVIGRSSSPSSRQLHASLRINDTAFLIQGGIRGKDRPLTFLSDMWMFVFTDLGQCMGSWHLMMNVSSPALPHRLGHTMTHVGNHILVLGSPHWSAPTPTPPSLLFRLALDIDHLTYDWSYVPLLFQYSTRNITSLYGHLVLRDQDDRLLLFGGWILPAGSAYYPLDNRQVLVLNISTELDHISTVIATLFYQLDQLYTNLGIICSSLFSLRCQVDNYQCSSGFSVEKLHTYTNTCLAGYYYNLTMSRCDPCQRGRWGSRDTGQECSRCPNGTSTIYCASVSSLNCTPCAVPGICSGHGSCSALEDGLASCSCDFGYIASDSCKFPFTFVFMGVAILTAAVLLFLARNRYIWYKGKRRRTQLLLVETSKRIHDLNAVWFIEEDQLSLNRVLGHGSYGEAWLADFNDTQVVVKKLNRHSLVDAVSREEFRREAEIMKTKRHQNIVLFLGAGRNAQDEPFLVMEYIKRGPLSSILADFSTTLSHADSLKFMLDTARGMSYLHGCNPPTIHRDLKCSNLLVTERWVVKVADFGTARLLSRLDEHMEESIGTRVSVNERSLLLDSPGSDTLTHCIGTPDYLSPEMFSGEPYTTSTDVYR